MIILCYFLWSYVQFFFVSGVFPTTGAQFLNLISPYGYQFHFVGLLVGMVIAIIIFLKKIKNLFQNQFMV